MGTIIPIEIYHPMILQRQNLRLTNAEIAAWDKNDNWYEFDTDTVKGWVSPNEVLDFMNMIAAKD